MRTLKIKGAWVVNVISKGSLNAGFTYDEVTQTANDEPSWNPSATLQQYGTYYYGDAETGVRVVPVVVNNSPSPLNVLGKEGHGNLMLIPENKKSWDGVSTSTDGAYLLLLCRVDYTHIGEITADPDDLDKYLRTFIPGDFVTNSPKNPNPTLVNIITTRPDGKDVGDYVLDDPLQFKVTVTEWGNAGTWTNGNDDRANSVSEE